MLWLDLEAQRWNPSPFPSFDLILLVVVVRALQGNKSTVFCTIADFGSAHNFILRRGPPQSDGVAVPEDGFLSNSVGRFVCVPSVIIIKSIHSHRGVHMEDVWWKQVPNPSLQKTMKNSDDSYLLPMTCSDGSLDLDEFDTMTRYLFRNTTGDPHPIEEQLVTEIFDIFDGNAVSESYIWRWCG